MAADGAQARDGLPGGPVVERLTTADCWSLLETAELARLAVRNASGDPELFPVNYASQEGIIYIRTANDNKLQHIRAHPRVAMEIDGAQGEKQWSVVVQGDARQVTTDAELRRPGVAELHSWIPTRKPYILRIEPTSVTGRRFAKAVANADPPAHEAGPSPSDGGRRAGARATRPQPIPHWPPFSS